MDSNQTQPISDPTVFADWVGRVASHNEQFAESLRDSAEIMATFDFEAAMVLYRAADTAHATVHALRTSIPTIPPAPPQPSRLAKVKLVMGDLLAAFFAH
jgi:hypothetical protein